MGALFDAAGHRFVGGGVGVAVVKGVVELLGADVFRVGPLSGGQHGAGGAEGNVADVQGKSRERIVGGVVFLRLRCRFLRSGGLFFFGGVQWFLRILLRIRPRLYAHVLSLRNFGRRMQAAQGGEFARDAQGLPGPHGFRHLAGDDPAAGSDRTHFTFLRLGLSTQPSGIPQQAVDGLGVDRRVTGPHSPHEVGTLSAALKVGTADGAAVAHFGFAHAGNGGFRRGGGFGRRRGLCRRSLRSGCRRFRFGGPAGRGGGGSSFRARTGCIIHGKGSVRRRTEGVRTSRIPCLIHLRQPLQALFQAVRFCRFCFGEVGEDERFFLHDGGYFQAAPLGPKAEAEDQAGGQGGGQPGQSAQAAPGPVRRGAGRRCFPSVGGQGFDGRPFFRRQPPAVGGRVGLRFGKQRVQCVHAAAENRQFREFAAETLQVGAFKVRRLTKDCGDDARLQRLAFIRNRIQKMI